MIENEFMEAVGISYKAYLESGARSNNKLKFLHSFIAQVLQIKLGNEFEIKSLGYNSGKEAKAEGKYYKKNLDISISKDGKTISALALKFVTSNYKQNVNNYFENLLGETANLRRNNLIYGQILILRKETPYLKSGGIIKAIELVNDANLSKYLKLENDLGENIFHRPDLTFVTLIDTGDAEEIRRNINQKIKDITNLMTPLIEIKKSNDLQHLSDETKAYLIQHSFFGKFIDDFVELTKARDYENLQL